LQKLRLRYEDLRQHNPRLVYAHLTGFGKAGAEVDIPAYDRTTWWARSGLMDTMRPARGEPRTSALGLGDQSAGLALFGAVMLALYQREQTGEGAEVSASLTGTGAWCHALTLQATLGGAEQVRMDGSEALTHAFALPYQTADDRWFSIWATDEEQCFTQMTSLIGLGALQQDPRFIDAQHRQINASLLAQEVAGAVATRTWAEWKAAFDHAGVYYVVASSVEEVVADPQLLVNGVFPHLQGTNYRATRTIDSPLSITGMAKVAPGPAPALGEHSRQILQDYGFTADAIDALCAAGIVTGPP
jgi:formyl-CoA transferase